MISRNAIHDALQALVAPVTWAEHVGGFTRVSDMYVNFSEDDQQPSMYVMSHDEVLAERTGQPGRDKMYFKLVVHFHPSEGVSGRIEGGHILDALQTALVPRPVAGAPFDGRQTLGGLVHHAFVEGRVFRDSGDLDKQAVIVLPITVLVP